MRQPRKPRQPRGERVRFIPCYCTGCKQRIWAYSPGIAGHEHRGCAVRGTIQLDPDFSLPGLTGAPARETVPPESVGGIRPEARPAV